MIKKNKAFDEEEEKENKIYEMTKIVKSTLIENKIVKWQKKKDSCQIFRYGYLWNILAIWFLSFKVD